MLRYISTMTTDEAIQKVWNYHHVHHVLKKADAIMVLGSHDVRVPEYAAKLYHEEWAPLMIFSGTGFGHRGDLLKTDFGGKAEADYFADIAQQHGVPREAMLIENKSQNTGQNFEFTGELLKTKGIQLGTVIVVTKPYMERRAYATGKRWWPDVELILSTPSLSFEQYVSGDIGQDDIINLMVGDLERIKEYPKLGFQIEQEIPNEVWKAFEQLVKEGYIKHLIESSV